MRFRTFATFAGITVCRRLERDGRSVTRGVSGFVEWPSIDKARAAVIVSLILLTRCAFGEVVFQPVYTTAPSPTSYSPFMGVTEGSNGNFYGMRYESQFSQTNCILFRVTPSGLFTKVATLSGERPASSFNGALLVAKDGNFYGTTPYGGTFQKGLIFRYNGSAVSRIFSFDGVTAGVPKFSLVEASDGFLYGVTTDPAAIYCATTNGIVTVLTNFPAYNMPIDGLVEGPDEWLYGATYYYIGGGVGPPPGHESGRVYKFSASGGFKTLQYVIDDARPQASPIKGNDGFLYGPVGPDSYSSTNQSSIYRMTTNGATTNVFAFTLSNGWTPSSRLLLASDGSFCGICSGGGAFGYGTIFRMSSNGTFTVLVQLNGTNGTMANSYLEADSDVPLIEARSGTLYGTMSCLLRPTTATAQRVFRLVEPPVVQCEAGGDQPAMVRWNSFSGGVYQVSYKTSVDATDWITLVSSFTATSHISSCSDDSAAAEQRFYRITLLP